MADSFAVLVAPCSQDEAEAGTNNDKPVTPLRTKQQVDAMFASGEIIVDATANNYMRWQGVDRDTEHPEVGKYLLTIGDDSGIPGLKTNGYVCINGPSTTDPLGNLVAGEGDYMLAINSDVGTEPTVVIKTSSDTNRE